MRLRVKQNRVLLRRVEIPEKIGSIIVPETAKEKPQHAIVLMVGEDVTLCRPGDRVVIGRWSGSDVNLPLADGSEDWYLVVREDEILAYIEESEAIPDLDPGFDVP